MGVRLRTAIVTLCMSPLAMAEPLPPSMTYRQLPTEAPSVIAARDRSEKPKIMERQRRTLEQRYDLSDRPRPGVMMSGGRKAVQQGRRVRLASGATWDDLAAMTAADIPDHTAGFARCLQGSFADHQNVLRHLDRNRHACADGRDAPPADAVPQEEFNQTEDRKSADPSMGVACLDCHANFHTNAAFHLTPDLRPQGVRFRLDTTSLRGMFNQQIHGSKRSRRSVEDFTEFEQRTAYFNGDHVSATRKGGNLPDRPTKSL